MIKNLVLALALMLLFNGSVSAATAHTLYGDCPGSSNKWKTVTYYKSDGTVESTENTDCNGVVVITTYRYDLVVVIDIETDGSATVEFNGPMTQFKVDKATNMVIKDASTGVTSHSYSGTISANTWTTLPSLVSGELYVLIASNPSTGVLEAAAVYEE